MTLAAGISPAVAALASLLSAVGAFLAGAYTIVKNRADRKAAAEQRKIDAEARAAAAETLERAVDRDDFKAVVAAQNGIIDTLTARVAAADAEADLCRTQIAEVRREAAQAKADAASAQFDAKQLSLRVAMLDEQVHALSAENEALRGQGTK